MNTENQTSSHIFVVDDDREMQSLLADFLHSRNYRVSCFSTAVSALERIESAENPPDLIISDINMPQMSGIEFAQKIKILNQKIPIILITAFGSIESAIQAIRKGAYDYVVKPFKLAEISVTIDRALEYKKISVENTILKSELKKSWSYENLIGKSQAMKSVIELIQRVSSSNANILINGESGTGKEMVARAIHNSGNRRNMPFVAINCTAIPENLLESELFGHAKGAFTGAVQRKKGLFEEAEGGTLFLDEIGDMNPALQAKLLRVIQERKIRPVGDTASKDIDVRIIAATHKDLKEGIKNNFFREDLYYRLSVIPILIPPLRHRREDIPALANYFLKKYAAMNNASVSSFSKDAMQKMISLEWEGNVRELENVVERAVVLCQGDSISSDLIPDSKSSDVEGLFGKAATEFPSIELLEKRYIKLVLDKTGGRKEKAAQILGINRRTLYRKEREYGLLSSDEMHAEWEEF